ncbi:MAG TPA: chemotaxis protein CheA [Conexibacter sp.]
MLDQHEYLPAFLAEAREHLQTLGLAIVRIEASPDDRPAADTIFRVAHSLKGMSAAMGFGAIAELTHAMEDVFELLRQRSGGLPPDAIDVLSACLDALEGAVERIAEGGDADAELDPAPLVERLRLLARERTPAQELARDGDVALPDLARQPVAGEALLHVAADLAEECQMPAVRAFMLFEALRAHGDLVGGVPAPDMVERFAGRRVEAWVATRAEASSLEESARAVGEFADVRVREQRLPAIDGAEPCGDPAAAGPAAPSAVGATPRAGASVRVDAERLDELLHLLGELVQHRTTVEALAAEAVDAVPALGPAVQRLARTSQALQETVTRVRMVPVESVFLRFPRVARDLAARLGKQVELRLQGADTELDRTVVDALGDPLVHLVRNALDHGLETPAERVAGGKPPTGVLELSARHAGGHVIVAVRDDGRGIDPLLIAHTAVARGLLDVEAADALDAAGAAELLFAPGFSTAPETTDLSGRGVGMHAVREGVRALGGEVSLVSTPDEGTVASLRLPLTLASIAALLVTVDELPYAIPLERVARTVRLDAVEVRTVRGAPLLPLGGELLPLCDVAGRSPLAVTGQRTPSPGYAVVLNAANGRRIALAVSSLEGQRELVTRRLPRSVSPRASAAAGAVLPDGQVALVLDCDSLSPGQPEGVTA